jgi:hypothetical protein
MTRSPSISTVALVGRKAEQQELADALGSGRPELIAIYGRRRVGKTYLVRTFYAEQLCFELTGVRDATRAQQLAMFVHAMEPHVGQRIATPPDWPSAFQALARLLESQRRDGKRKVIFFDELPWLASRRSGFLAALDHFWNTWASRQQDLIVVICGSAASWMISKVLHDKGGLHNRVTRTLALYPFRLHEAEAFLQHRGITLDRKQILELYMALGGIPYYLDYVRRGRSAAQAIDAVFFAGSAPLRDEFDKLYAALFEQHERHIKVIRALAKKQSGLTRNEIVRATHLPTGGSLTTILAELETTGFILQTLPFGKTSRDSVYRLVDEYSLFYLRWVDGKRSTTSEAGEWLRDRLTPAGQAWGGYAFENTCLTHVSCLKRALGIGGVQTQHSTWSYRPADTHEHGAQIDLLIDRKDGVINLCEMKFGDTAYEISKKYAGELRTKEEVFRRVTGTRKTVFVTIVSPYGIKPNQHSQALVQGVVTADDLFDG